MTYWLYGRKAAARTHQSHPAIASMVVAAKGEKEEQSEFAYTRAQCNRSMRSNRMTGLKFFCQKFAFCIRSATAANAEKQNKLAFTTR